MTSNRPSFFSIHPLCNVYFQAGLRRRPSLRRTQSTNLPNALRRKLSSASRGGNQEEVLEGTGSMNYSLIGFNSSPG